ncbi:MAG: ATP phosphoribosyltransferase [Hyphomonadaceae bacterium]|nr:ATP phosphoribosyltransferase [Hyphomonadaceae bacterium]
MTRLTIAIPSKGRLKEKSEEWLTASGFTLRQKGGGRGYSAELKGLPEADVMLLSAREIAEELIAGNLHIGITGEDLLNDLSPSIETDVEIMRRLGFGGADVIVAVPAAWLDVETMADLEAAGVLFRERHGRRMRVATKYMRLTRQFFAEKSVGEYRLIESPGATEAAPAAGTAEVIVDITSTGATLKANDLKILQDGVILKSEASLVGSLKAIWSDDAIATLRVFLDGLEATAAAKTLSRLEVDGQIAPELAERFDLTLLSESLALCLTNKASEAARALASSGARTVAIATVNQVFTADNAVFEKFVKKLSQTA